MLYGLDQTLERILIEKGRLNKSEIDIAFDQPTGEWSARLSRPTLNCWCFDIRENLKLRKSMQPRITRNDRMATTMFPSRFMELTYLVTAWARKPEDEHQLIWRALAALKAVPRIAPIDCEGNLRYQESDVQMVVADMSYRQINLVDLWGVLENQMRLGFIVIATVELDTDLSIEAPLVLDATVRVGQSEVPLERELSALDVELKHPTKKDEESD